MLKKLAASLALMAAASSPQVAWAQLVPATEGPDRLFSRLNVDLAQTAGPSERRRGAPDWRRDAPTENFDSAPLVHRQIGNRSLAHTVSETAAGPPPDLKSLLRPRVRISAEWAPQVNGLGVSSYDASVQMPLYPVFGPPPPFVTSSYSLTQIDAPAALDLPSNLHDYSLGLAWMRRINDRWMARFMLSGAFATDLDNTSSDAWQLRAGAFAMYRPNQRWTFAFGALATGRDDIPVLPAVGAIWEPSPRLKVNLMMPKPRVSLLLADNGTRQHWGYLGGGISGGTWAYDRSNGLGDRLSYREWRLVLGWESTPPRPPGTFRTMGTTMHVEVGYIFGREFEFDSASPDVVVQDALLLRTGLSF